MENVIELGKEEISPEESKVKSIVIRIDPVTLLNAICEKLEIDIDDFTKIDSITLNSNTWEVVLNSGREN